MLVFLIIKMKFINSGLVIGYKMPKKLTKSEFITKANKNHKGLYDYSLVEYIDNRTPVIITCKIEGHGQFPQIPDNQEMEKKNLKNKNKKKEMY